MSAANLGRSEKVDWLREEAYGGRCGGMRECNTAGCRAESRRIILSDGQYFIQAMLATQLNVHVDNKELDKNVVIRLTEFVTNAVQGRK